MAIEDILSKLPKVFGTTPEVYRGLLDAPERASLENRANIGGLLGFASALAQGMSPQGYRRSAAQNILTALGAGYGAAGQTYDAGLNQVSNVMKLAQAKRQISGLATLKAAHPDLAYLADVSPDEFVRIVSARERAKRYGLLINPNAAPSASPVVSSDVPSVSTTEVRPATEPVGLISADSGGFPVSGGYGSIGVPMQAAPRVFDDSKPFAISSGLPAPVASAQAAPAPSPAAPSPAAPVPAPSAAPATKNILVNPQDQAQSDRLYAAAVEAELMGDKPVAEEYRRQAKILNPDETITFRDGILVSSRRGVLMKVLETETLNPEQAAALRLPTDKGQIWQREPSGKISRVEGTESTELDKAQLIKTLPGQFANVYPTLQNRAKNLIARAPTLTRDQINAETKDILDADSKILADLDPKLLAAEKERRKSGATVVYPPGSMPLGKEGSNKVDTQLLELGQSRLRLQSIASNFNPKYLERPFQLRMIAVAEAEKLGRKPSPKDAEDLAAYSEFAQTAYNELNAYINFITGAAVGSGEEEARIRKGVPDPQKDSPTQFFSKLNTKIKEGRLYEARLGYIKNKGMKITDAGIVDVNQIPTLMRNREAEIKKTAKLFGGKEFDAKDPNHKAIVRSILAKEFGLVD